MSGKLPQIPQKSTTPNQLGQDVASTLRIATESLNEARREIFLLREQHELLIAWNILYEQELQALRAQLQQHRGPEVGGNEVETPLTTSNRTAVAVGTPIPTLIRSNNQGAAVTQNTTVERDCLYHKHWRYCAPQHTAAEPLKNAKAITIIFKLHALR